MKKSCTISVDKLENGMEIFDSVYVMTEQGPDAMLVRKNMIVDERIIALLKKHNVQQISVRRTPHFDFEDIQEAPERKAPEKKLPEKKQPVDSKPPAPSIIIPKKPVPTTPKPEVKPIIDEEMRKEAVSSISGLFNAIVSTSESGNMTTAFQAITGIEKVLGQLVDAATSDASGLVHINDLKCYDEYTYHHSLSVALLSIATGQEMGLHQSDLTRLGRCALMHDVGKQFMPIELINKAGRLTDEEFELIKGHPSIGAVNLKAKALGNTEMWGAVMFHHEKYNGKGYPRGLKGNNIPLFSRIIAVADVYDAITSYRSYRKPMPPAQAYEILCSEVEQSFEYDIVKAFTARLDLYPLGSVLELSDKRVGIVIENEDVKRPVVKIHESGDIVDLANLKNLTISIVSVLQG